MLATQERVGTSPLHDAQDTAAPSNPSTTTLSTHSTIEPVNDHTALHPSEHDGAARDTFIDAPAPPQTVHMSRRSTVTKFKPAFRRWLHLVWLDFAVMALVLLLSEMLRRFASVYRMQRRVFPVSLSQKAHATSSDYDGPEHLSWPHEGLILPVWTLGALLPVVSGLILSFLQIFVRDFWDKTAAFLGLSKGLIAMYVLQPPYVNFAFLFEKDLQRLACCHALFLYILIVTASTDNLFIQWPSPGRTEAIHRYGSIIHTSLDPRF